MSAAYPTIAAVIPHSGGMILLDAIVNFSENEIGCLATVRSDNPYLSERGDVGAWVALEYMSQAMAAHSGLEALQRGEAPRVGLLLGTRRFINISQGGFKLGQILRVLARRSWHDSGMAVCEAAIKDEATGECLIEATLSVYAPKSIALLEGMRRK